ncbi:hypothetical protein LTS10_007884 [Elasticomyces elasticus]|nr:hypothetical protein LTS10_007884 [Elasticomyces elasticus]
MEMQQMQSDAVVQGLRHCICTGSKYPFTFGPLQRVPRHRNDSTNGARLASLRQKVEPQYDFGEKQTPTQAVTDTDEQANSPPRVHWAIIDTFLLSLEASKIRTYPLAIMVYHTYGSEITQRRLHAICRTMANGQERYDFWYDFGSKARRLITTNKKIMQAYLHTCGITYDRYDSLNRLDVLWQRFRKGQLALENCSKSELRGFCKQRGLVTHEHVGRATLTEALEKADENPKFERFCELPAELKDLVWEWRAVW